MQTYWIYDIETYPNCFTLTAKVLNASEHIVFEISNRRNDAQDLLVWLQTLSAQNAIMVGYNSVGFDYPVVHHFMKCMPVATAQTVYAKAQAIIDTPWNARFSNIIWESDRYVEQLDLYLINHFDNPAKATSLKMLEYNMCAASIQELPYPVGQDLTDEQIGHLIEYNKHDVNMTEAFFNECLEAIELRAELTEQTGLIMMNYNDTKIGKMYFQQKLEHAGVQCFIKNPGERKRPRQTARAQIHLGDVVLPIVKFNHPEFQRVLRWFMSQTITETKGAIEDLNATIDGFTYAFGTGGIHGSVESQLVESDDDYVILDLDVASYYPNLAIANRLYPEHLSEVFCDIYQDVYEQRKAYAKGTPQNAMFKLALNGVYGDSNNKYSPFFDPQYTMAITINGQLLLCMLADELRTISDLTMIQINTDGLTVRVRRELVQSVEIMAGEWEELTGLELETVHYSKMWIRDVNNYIAQYEDGKTKRKGAYQLPDEWHKNHSCQVATKAAFAALTEGADIESFIREHNNFYDFTLRTKVRRSDKLVIVEDMTGLPPFDHGALPVIKWVQAQGELDDSGCPWKQGLHTMSHTKDKYGFWKKARGVTDEQVEEWSRIYHSATGVTTPIPPPPHHLEIEHEQQKITRYYVSTNGGFMFKLMPPLAGKTETRRNSIEQGWKVTPCNRIEEATDPIDYSYYVAEARKLVDPILGQAEAQPSDS